MPRIKKPKPNKGERLAAHAESGENPELLPPKFDLRHMHSGYDLVDCTKDEKSAFADTLRKLSRLEWRQIRQAGRHGCGFEIIDRTSIVGDSVPHFVTEDVKLLAFRFCRKAPMVGFRTRHGVFTVLWLDRAFSLYDHG